MKRFNPVLLAVVLVVAVGIFPVAAQTIISGSSSPSPFPSYVATAAAGSNGFACQTNGCRVDLGTGANDYFDSNGTRISTPGQLSAASFSSAANFSAFGANSANLLGGSADGAAAIGVKLGNVNALTTAGAKILSLYSDNVTTEQAFVDKNGTIGFPQKCDSTGTPGNAICNQAAGRAAISAATTSVTITNSIVVATSIVTAVLQTNDTTCLSVHSVVPGAGSFVINVNGACNATTNVGWIVFK
jgi:hypothetical protein